MEARDERRLIRLQKQMAAVKLLIIDELGFVPLSRTGAELLFEMISQRYERGVDLSRFGAAPLIAYCTAKETNYGTNTDG